MNNDMEIPTANKPRRIGAIGNQYGTLEVRTGKTNGKHYWAIEDYNDHYWEEIPAYLCEALHRFADESLATKPFTWKY